MDVDVRSIDINQCGDGLGVFAGTHGCSNTTKVTLSERNIKEELKKVLSILTFRVLVIDCPSNYTNKVVLFVDNEY